MKLFLEVPGSVDAEVCREVACLGRETEREAWSGPLNRWPPEHFVSGGCFVSAARSRAFLTSPERRPRFPLQAR